MVLLFVACGDDSDLNSDASHYGNSNLPDNYSVRLPASVSGESSKSVTKADGYVSYLDRKKALIANLIARLKSPRTITISRVTGDSYAHTQLVAEIKFIKEFTQEFAIQFMAVDSAYNNILSYISANSVNTIPASNVSFTFTEPMANSYLATMGDFLTTDDINYVNQAIGQSGYFPEVVYETNVDSVYDYKITINGALMINPYDLLNPMPPEYSTNNQIIIKWNEAKTKVYVLRTMQDDCIMSSELSVYDSVNQTSTVRFNNSCMGMIDKLNIKLEGGQPKNGIILNVNYSMDDGMGNQFQDIMTGIADDEGGFLDETFIETGFTNYYRETFNGAGNLTGLSSSDDGIIWDTMPGNELDSDYYTTGTNSAMTGVINIAFSEVINTNCFINIVPLGTASEDVMFNSIGTAMIGIDTNNSMNWIDYWGDVSQVSNAMLFMEQEISNVNGPMITNVPITGSLYILPQ